MYIPSRTASLLFKAGIIVVAFLAQLDAIGALDLEYNEAFPYYFTNISNIAVLVYFCCDVVNILRGRNANDPWHPKVKYLCMKAITVTFLVAHFGVDGGMVWEGGTFHLQMLAVHYIVPVATILDWLLFDIKGRMSWKDPLYWPLFPLAYLAYIDFLVLGCGVRVSAENRWPYPFLNADLFGVPTVFLFVVVLFVAFVIVGELFVITDKNLARMAAYPLKSK